MSYLPSSVAIFGPVELPPEIARQRVVDEKTAAEFSGVSQVQLERMRKLGTAPRHVRFAAAARIPHLRRAGLARRTCRQIRRGRLSHAPHMQTPPWRGRRCG